MGSPDTHGYRAARGRRGALRALGPDRRLRRAPRRAAGSRLCSSSGPDVCPAGGAGARGSPCAATGASSSALAPPAAGRGRRRRPGDLHRLRIRRLHRPLVALDAGLAGIVALRSRRRLHRRSQPGLHAAEPDRDLGRRTGGDRLAPDPHLRRPAGADLELHSCAILDSSFAAAEGEAEAEDAVADAQAIGIGPGSPIYHDMESYTRTAAATASTMTFLAAWTQRLHELGYASGVYSSSASGIADLGRRWGTSFASPDDIWSANWNGRADTEDPNLTADAWPNHQRIHQYRGGHDEVWGGVRINIDSNYVDAMTVGTAIAAGADAAAADDLAASRSPGERSGSGSAAAGRRTSSVPARSGFAPTCDHPRRRDLGAGSAVAARTFRLRGGSSHTFTVLLDSRGRPLLAHRGRLRAQLLVAIPGARKTRAVLFPSERAISSATSASSRPPRSIQRQVRDLPHPGELAPGVVARPLLHPLDVAADQLVEAERLAGRARGPRGLGAAHLLRGAGGDDRLGAGVDPLVEGAPVHVEAEDPRRVPGVGRPQLRVLGFGRHPDQRELGDRRPQVEAGAADDDRPPPAPRARSRPRGARAACSRRPRTAR